MASKPIDKEKFEAFLRENGADVKATTNPYEVARFDAMGACHVIYNNKSGSITAQGFGMECLAAFRRGAKTNMGFTKRRGTLGGRHVGTIGGDLRLNVVHRHLRALENHRQLTKHLG